MAVHTPQLKQDSPTSTLASAAYNICQEAARATGQLQTPLAAATSQTRMEQS
jgi:hypothetical protein